MFGVCLRYAKQWKGLRDILQEGFMSFSEGMDLSDEGSFEEIRSDNIFVVTAIEQFRRKTYFLQPDYWRRKTSIEAKYLTVLDTWQKKEYYQFGTAVIIRLLEQC